MNRGTEPGVYAPKITINCLSLSLFLFLIVGAQITIYFTYIDDRRSCRAILGEYPSNNLF